MPYDLKSVQMSMETFRPPIIICHGTQKIGKSTFGANMDSPIFLRYEDSLTNINAPTFPLCETYDQGIDCMSSLMMEDHSYKTLVVDTIDHLEIAIHNKVCSNSAGQRVHKTIELADGGFGKGHFTALEYWKTYVKCLQWLRDNKGMTILQLAHSKIKEQKNPDAEIYDSYTMKIQDGKNVTCAGFLFETADIILFANYQSNIVREELPGDKTRNRAIGVGNRFLFTEERPSFKAGNRYGLPDKIPFTKDGKPWVEIKRFIPYFNQQQQGT